MTFIAQEESIEDGQPIELFLFQNLESKFAYTSGQEEVAFDGNTYIPRPISRTEPEVQSQQSDRNLVIKMPLNDPFVARYVNTLPASPDSITIFKFHSTDLGTEVVKFFVGEVAHVAVTGNEAKVNALSSGRVLAEQIPKQTFRNLCNHVLYDAFCAVDDSQFKMSTSVVAISADSLSITVSGGSNVILNTGLELSAQLTADPTFFDAGFFRRAGIEHRMVLTSVDNGGNSATFGVLLPFETLEVDTVLELFAGCDHQFPTCIAKFANTERYGGFPFIPRKNPFEVGVDK
ncbi:MAG: phage BR0599 family protein [Gemmatimonadota bacterium]